jgi:uncharacterized protein YwbE
MDLSWPATACAAAIAHAPQIDAVRKNDPEGGKLTR